MKEKQQAVTAAQIKQALAKKSSMKKQAASMRFFKTEKGAYGAHDQFIGVTVPEQRVVAKQFSHAPLSVIVQLLRSQIHEHRLTALILLVNHYKKADAVMREKIYRLYCSNTRYVNNWDLVDTSAASIVGAYLFGQSRAEQKRVLMRFAASHNLWEQRIAIIATQYFINHDDFYWTPKIADMLLQHPHDLIHKAVGWMLREMGKRAGTPLLEQYLQPHYQTMPRTMLRYAIERFPEQRRKQYLTGTV